MFSRTLRIAIGRRNKQLPSYQLASSFSSDEIKSPIEPENAKKPVSSSQLRTRLSLRRQKLPKFPPIDFVTDLSVEHFLPNNFKTVMHGDYQYQACLEDYVQVYTSGHQMRYPPNACGGYAVYYGPDHPLNESGPVDRRQGLPHTKLFGFLRALKSIPQNLISKVNLNVDDRGVGRFIVHSLPIMSENGFRSPFSGRLNKDLETSMEINTLLRTRQDLEFRIQYTPNNICFPPTRSAMKMAKTAAYEAERQKRIFRSNEKI